MLITKLPFNLSPKLVYTLATTVVTYLLTHYAITLDPDVSLAISTLLASAVGYKAPAGELIVSPVGDASDDKLPHAAVAGIANVPEPPVVE